MLISPSLLAADFSKLGEEVEKARGADMLHVDVMDGLFVPNISMGPLVMEALRGKTDLPFDVHLMIEHPLPYVPVFRKAGAKWITFHAECKDDPGEVINAILESGALAGMALKPKTDVEVLFPWGEKLSTVTIMTVEPGFGGQKFMEGPLQKIERIKKRFPHILCEIDGGVNGETAPLCRQAGADILVAGTAVFRASSPAAAIETLRNPPCASR